MLERIERKSVNLLLAWDLLWLNKKRNSSISGEQRIQNKRVRGLMKKAYTIPFYRKRFDERGLTPEDFNSADDLYKFPVLTKNELREWMDNLIQQGGALYKFYYLDTTSGSSGTPTKVLYSPREKAWNMANWMRVLIKGGYNPFFGMTASRMSAHSVSAGQKNIFQRMGYLRREFVNQYATEENVVEQINSIKPDLLYMTKTELLRVAIYCKRNHIKVWQPSFFVPTGEMIDRQTRELFEDVFGRGMIDSYGTTETGAVMARYPDSEVWEINTDLFAINLYDDSGEPAEEGLVCVTPLYRTEIPLINYLVGDRATSSVVEGKKVITSIQGRSNDFLSHKNGEVTTFSMIAPIFANCDEIIQVRLVQETFEDLLIQAVPKKDYEEESKKEIEDKIIIKMNEKLKQPMNIRFFWVPVIPPDKNGKLRLIVNNIKLH